MKYAKLMVLVICGVLVGIADGTDSSQPKMRNLALNKEVKVSTALERGLAKYAVDGRIGTRWISHSDILSWIEIDLGEEAHVGGMHVYSGYGDTAPIINFIISYDVGGQWKDIPSGRIHGNGATATWIKFDETVQVVTRKLRILVAKTDGDVTRIKEIKVWPYMEEGIPPLGFGVKGWVKPIDQDDVPLIYLNQSGFNLNKPKRFTTPTMKDGTTFVVRKKDGKKPLFKGVIKNRIGDFSDFNPIGKDEFVVEAGGHISFPFRIGPWWIERVTYQHAVDFMNDSRHYLGTSRKPIGNSVGWRDDCHFAFELNTLVAQYLSNPAAYERMPGQVKYEMPPKPGLWGALQPYPHDASDIVKMIHWGADIIVSKDHRHEMLKEQLAYFLYAWPWLEKWLDRQNYEVVSEYVFAHWGDPKVYKKYAFDKTPEHDLFAVKELIGSTKGEMPPGHSVQPNLMMYEVAKRQGRKDAEKYFQAAFAQVEWMIANLDWNDPQTTKGQRMSEHVTMTGLAHFLGQYPDRAPKGLDKKIEEWAKVMIRRSDNLWDFRKLSDGSDWVPSGSSPLMWNEPGNVAGFPACAAAAMSVIKDPAINDRLEEMVYSHMDNVFGRNPTGRHFSFDAPKEVEGVEIGWYSKYGTGVGMLEKARFVLEAAPKKEHYPYNPQAGNVGWSEGWVNFNTAYNASLAYMAYNDTKIKLTKNDGKITVTLHAPLNFDYAKDEPVAIWVTSCNGDKEKVILKETSPYSQDHFGSIPVVIAGKKTGDGKLQIEKNGHIETSYGFGYMKRSAGLRF